MYRLAPLALLVACGQAPSPAIGGGGAPGANTSSSTPAPATASSPQPRDPTAHPPLFHLDAHGGPVLAAMELYTVVWKGDDALGAKVDAFHAAMLGSQYWTSRLGEYGV